MQCVHFFIGNRKLKLFVMGAFLDKPNTDKHNETGAGMGLRYGLSSMQGWRLEMEDAHCAVIGLPGSLKEWSFFAVFDGHAGDKVSAYCAEHLLEAITTNADFRGKAEEDGGNEFIPSVENVKTGIKTGFLALDDKMRGMPEMVSGQDKSGSTAVTILVSPKHIFFANCGDSRAVLSRSAKCEFATSDHKPINPEEKERIQNAGGSVMIQRVNGSLAVSRALGDFEYKHVEGKGPCEQLVSPEPEISVHQRAAGDEFIILACDGIWDVMGNAELCDFVRDRLTVTEDLSAICNHVVDICLDRGSRDNMSIAIVTFEGAPSVSEDAKKKDKELDAKIADLTKEVFEENSTSEEKVTTLDVMNVLTRKEITNLPPGGGLWAKKYIIEDTLNKLNPPPN